MAKEILRFLGIVTAICFAAISCEEKVPEDGGDNTGPDDKVEVVAPIASVEVTELERTSVSFTIKSDSDGDYAWTIVPADQTIESAEELFESGKTGMFGEEKTFSTTYNELEGGMKYNLYVAVRKINPYVYSELLSETLSTEFEYKDMITLEKVSATSISYHIEMPEDAVAYRHMIMDYNDFLYFQALVGVTHSSYLSAFGLGADESATYACDWVQYDGWNNYPTYIYSDTKYLILAGKSAGTTLDDAVLDEDVKVLEFTTPKAEECPYEVDVVVSDITSLTAKVTVTPEEGIDRYRAVVMSEADYQSFLFEGEEMVRRAVIGPWDDTSNEFDTSAEFSMTGLMPDTRYYVCIMAFDKDMRELYIEETFNTAEPSGPTPVVVVEKMDVEEPWNSHAVNLKMENTVGGVMMLRSRYVVDEVLNAPGNEDLTMDVIIKNNGEPMSAAVLSSAASDEGCKLQFEGLSSNTDYVFGVMATNDEHVSTYHVYEFTTGAEPVVETTLFDKLKGEYTASITDIDGKLHTFDVTITDGVNDATRADYTAENLLVCLGFDPIGVKYHSPQDLLDKGWAKDEDEANRNYGPKWFLEIDKNDKITTYRHAVASTFYDNVNMVEIIDYSAEGEDPMMSYNGKTYWFKGTFWRDFSNPNREDQAMATTLIHDVDYDAEAKVLTVKPVTHYKIWSAKGQMITEYPGVEKAAGWAGGNGSEVVFCGNSALVLTRKAEPEQREVMFCPAVKPLRVPVMRQIDVRYTRPVIKGR